MANPTSPRSFPPGSGKRLPTPAPQDKRQTPRRDLEREVYIEVEGKPPIPCTLADVSRSGARLAVADPAAVPDEFLITLKDDLRRWCRVVRRLEKHVGIQFIEPPQTASPPVAPAEALEEVPKPQPA